MSLSCVSELMPAWAGFKDSPWPARHLFSLVSRIFTREAQNMTTENLDERMWAKVIKINNWIDFEINNLSIIVFCNWRYQNEGRVTQL